MITFGKWREDDNNNNNAGGWIAVIFIIIAFVVATMCNNARGQIVVQENYNIIDNGPENVYAPDLSNEVCSTLGTPETNAQHLEPFYPILNRETTVLLQRVPMIQWVDCNYQYYWRPMPFSLPMPFLVYHQPNYIRIW